MLWFGCLLGWLVGWVLMQGRGIFTPLLTGHWFPATGCSQLRIWSYFWNALLLSSCISPFLMHNLDFSLLEMRCLRNCWCCWEKNNNNKTVQRILCEGCSGCKHIYTSLNSPYFCLWGVYMNTEPLLFGNSPIRMRSHKFLLHIRTFQFLWYPDGWMDGQTMGGREIRSSFLF